jgi:hypothetical protein
MTIENTDKKHLKNENELPFYVHEIQRLYIDLAHKYLEESNPLKRIITDYYSDTERLANELSNVFKGKNESEIKAMIEFIRKRYENPTFFVERNQKIHERTAAFERTRQREANDPAATQEEYNLGTYTEALEMQVRDAVIILQKKGYKSFQSGFREKEDDRRQFMDFYNKNIQLPQHLLDSFQKRGFKLYLVEDSDRTTLFIDPTIKDPITLGEWKKIWDEFSEMMPEAEDENFDNIKKCYLHAEFRKKQDLLKK